VNSFTKENNISKNTHDEYDLLPGGSNGFAIAPSKTISGNALLYINPHVTFYFRPEIAMQSEEGLHAYGAVTWGQFLFIRDSMNILVGCTHRVIVMWLIPISKNQ